MKKCVGRWLLRRGGVGAALGAVALGLGLSGCDEMFSGVACDTSAAAGITVSVRLGDGGELSCVAAVTITDGTVTETLQAIGHPCQYAGAFERTGKWTVTAKQKGYLPATQTGVEVVAGECHVVGQAVTLTLQPE